MLPNVSSIWKHPWCLKDVIGNVMLQGIYQNMPWNKISSGHLQDIKNHVCLGNIIWEYLQPKDSKRLAKHVGPTSPKHCPNVTPTLAECWPNVVPMSARCWLKCQPNLSPTTDKSMLCQCWADFGMNISSMSAWLHHVIRVVGKSSMRSPVEEHLRNCWKHPDGKNT